VRGAIKTDFILSAEIMTIALAAIAKVASASIDDVIGQASKAGAKAAGAVIDDAAVTPKYVQGFAAARELPIVWKIARASAFNKLVILLPAALLLSTFAPWLIPLLLILGGLYLCYEGAHKLHHWLSPKHDDSLAKIKTPEATPLEAAHLEEQRVRGAIKTDFILSAEIMTISLAATDATVGLWFQGAVLAIIAIVITVAVYGAVALIVKADDIGLHLASDGSSARIRGFGRGLVKAMPGFMKGLTVVGTAAMLWVGGNIVVHALHEIGVHLPYETIKTSVDAIGSDNGFVRWLGTALLDGIVGVVLGFAVLVGVNAVSARFGKKDGAAAH
jgi:predicted DNA repair protein MutK